MAKFHYLKVGLAAIFGFVGVKMLMADFFKVPVALSLAVIISVLVVAIAASLLRARRLGMVDHLGEQSATAG